MIEGQRNEQPVIIELALRLDPDPAISQLSHDCPVSLPHSQIPKPSPASSLL